MKPIQHSPKTFIVRELLKLFALMLCIIAPGEAALGSGEVTVVYFFPFDIDTYIPITTETIKGTATQKWTLTDTSHVSHLLLILNQGDKARFDNENVRAAVFTHGQIYYLNRDGVVKNGKYSYKINMNDFWKFRASLSEQEMHPAN